MKLSYTPFNEIRSLASFVSEGEPGAAKVDVNEKLNFVAGGFMKERRIHLMRKKPEIGKATGKKVSAMGPARMKKQYLKSRPNCKVTFCLCKEAVRDASNVTVVGDFNSWDKNATPLKKQKDGGFSITLELECGREYRFRYLIDGWRWENDWNADKYSANPFGEEDSVITV